ncbi:MAG: electron transfer flavoprotein-ubiquinone oxidoreductase [Ferrovum sp.]|nr:electron transfer flavoprotein-ubiquinone oxidoreductase [Ferrovum sp.]NDU87511.1 electron transfer flavoprotein-ubiquinone oxidoreductase [Ferrovum sp.]
MTTRESLSYDVVIVGAGPSGLGCAIRLKQLSQAQGLDLSVCILEKGAEIGAHILSGAVIEPRALTELIPDWQQRGAPLLTPVSHDEFHFLTRQRKWALPTPPALHNAGNYIASLGALCRWLGEQAEGLGVEIYPGFAATELLTGADGTVQGVITGDVGRLKEGQPGPRFQPGMELRARQTVVAEGCRGSLARQLIEGFGLSQGSQPQTYGLGLKEIWEVDPAQHRLGQVSHTVGWPLKHDTYGGSWIYHMPDHLVSVGLVVGLDYDNPYLSPFEEFQRFKTHPAIRPLFAGGRRLAYGARALSEGGWQSIPRLTFPGGLLVGDSAGFMNVAKIKGSHTALKSGMVAAEALFPLLQQSTATECTDYPVRLRASWVEEELYTVRNLRPAFNWGLWPGMIHAALDSWMWRGRAPWTLHHHGADHEKLRPAAACTPPDYPRPDGQVSFDRASSVFLAQTAHEESQPDHLRLKDPEGFVRLNWERYRAPETRYCPAGVYEIVRVNEETPPRLQINAANCIHCKTCDIKDPSQNIVWVPPEGGSGPHYANL